MVQISTVGLDGRRPSRSRFAQITPSGGVQRSVVLVIPCIYRSPFRLQQKASEVEKTGTAVVRRLDINAVSSSSHMFFAECQNICQIECQNICQIEC